MMMTWDRYMHLARRSLTLQHLTAAKGNQLVAAETMGVHRNTLYRFMREDNITAADVRKIRAEAPERTAMKTTVPYGTKDIYSGEGRKQAHV